MIYTVIVQADDQADAQVAFAEWRSDCDGLFTTPLFKDGELVAYVTNGFFEEEPRGVFADAFVSSGEDVLQVIDGLGYTLSSGDDDGAL